MAKQQDTITRRLNLALAKAQACTSIADSFADDPARVRKMMVELKVALDQVGDASVELSEALRKL